MVQFISRYTYLEESVGWHPAKAATYFIQVSVSVCTTGIGIGRQPTARSFDSLHPDAQSCN